MKHKFGIIVILSLLVSITLSSCNMLIDLLSTPDPTEPAPSETLVPTNPKPEVTLGPEATPTAKPEPMPEVDYLPVYREKLDFFHHALTNGIEDWEYGKGEAGLLEYIMNMPEPDTLEKVGYTIQDLNGDGIPELLIVQVDEPVTDEAKGKVIFAAFSAVDDKVELIFEGWYRNAFYYLGDGKVYNTGSAGAMYSIFGTYRLSADGRKLDCEDYYFTYEKDESLQEIGYYYNNRCELEKSISTELDGGQEAFEQTQSAFSSQIQTLSITPFSKYQASGQYTPARAENPINIHLAEEALANFSSYDTLTADESEYQVKILLSSTTAVKNFKFLRISVTDIDANGKIIADTEAIYNINTLQPEHPLVVTMTFFGTLPSYGISYETESGETKSFYISQSGKDGSLMLIKF